MKTILATIAAIAALIITPTTSIAAPTVHDVHIVAVDEWANSNGQQFMVGETGWTAERWTFVPQWLSGAYRLFWNGLQPVAFGDLWHSDPWRCDFIVMRFSGPVNVGGIGVYTEAWRVGGWITPAASLPGSGATWAAYRVAVNQPGVSVALIASGTGEAPTLPSFFEPYVP